MPHDFVPHLLLLWGRDHVQHDFVTCFIVLMVVSCVGWDIDRGRSIIGMWVLCGGMLVRDDLLRKMNNLIKLNFPRILKVLMLRPMLNMFRV
jgi:hypothetical protein